MTKPFQKRNIFIEERICFQRSTLKIDPIKKGSKINMVALFSLKVLPIRLNFNTLNLVILVLFFEKTSDLETIWQAILLFIMQNRYLICYIRYLI